MAINEAALINAAVHTNLLTNEQINEARQTARRERMKLLEVLGRDFRLPATAFYQSIAEQRKIGFLTLNELIPNQELMEKLPGNLLLRRLVIPVTDKQGELVLAVADPDDQVAVDSVRRVVNKPLTLVLAEPVSLTSVIKQHINAGQDPEEQDPVVLFNDLMKDAYVRRASDIHLEPSRSGMKARMRVDGQLLAYPKLLNDDESSMLVNRIKVLAHLDISEQREPQDGGFSYAIEDWNLSATDLRIATLPSRWGERITMRVLGQEDNALKLIQLGMEPSVLEKFQEVLRYPHGMVLVTGPTGSGKSTTLYGALRELNRSDFNVLTVEDPIEQLLTDITQVQVSTKMGFAEALRSFLRHDPDIILVGEIRDQDTAETAMKAAMTGHLVLSTLHTNDATSAMGRLRNIGCESFMIASTVRMVIAQRLARRLCKICRIPLDKNTPEYQQIGAPKTATLFKAKGCPGCVGTGYSGRIGLYELFIIDDDMASHISAEKDSQELRKLAGPRLHSLWQDAKIKAASGETSVEEILPLKEDLDLLEGAC